ATEAPEPTKAPTATRIPSTPAEATDPYADPTPNEPEQDEGTSKGGGTGTTILIVVLAVVAALATIGVVAFSWLGWSPGTDSVEPVIGGGAELPRSSPQSSLRTLKRSIQNSLSLFQKLSQDSARSLTESIKRFLQSLPRRN
ncbi:MAG TPA: hypothetical protein DGL25_01935, partial [Dehalococcoidia bacterium]|nr:hypothetical protein [Dehalococcoidia bacterium]